MRVMKGYHAFATNTPIQHIRGVALLYRYNNPQFQVKKMKKHEPNVLCSQVSSGGRRWFIVGCYLAPNNVATIERLVTAIGQRPRGAELMVAGYLNTNSATPGGSKHMEEITASISTSGMQDISTHFLLHHKYWAWDRRTWCMRHLVRKVWSRTEYILGMDIRMFQNV